MRLLIGCLLLFSSLLHASVKQSVEQIVAKDLATSLGVYKRHVSSAPLESWAQLSLVSPGFYGLNVMLKGGSVTELFLLVPLDDRNRFPLGNLIFVQSRAMQWPTIWKTEDPNNPGKYLDHPGHQELRFFVYEKDGKFIADRWYETKFQAMLAETGLTVPPPTPYYPSLPPPPGEKPVGISQSPAPVIAPVAVPTSAPAVPPPAKSSNPLWWIVGAIAALAAVVALVARHRKPKA